LFLKWWQNDKISCLRLFQDSKSIHGFNLVQLLLRGSNDTRRYLGDIMHKIFILYKEGKIKPVVDSVFTFEDVEQKNKYHFFFNRICFFR
jgi:NADPH:quinone reductase-like Zn-dependent oxidoreductase